jgi:HSP20 family molecular chaperone IbpA
MSLFPRSYFAPETSFTPLFRLLDDFDSYSREVSSQGNSKAGSRRALPSFSPRFDVKETETGYELHGELPGVEKENVTIEFSEPQTLVISGRTERSYTSGTPPAGLIETGTSGAITEGGEGDAHHSHKATVEDEDAEKAKEQQATEVAKADQQQQQQQQQKPREKFWVSERSIGEFSRTFNFPTPVDQEAVAANLNNGILSVTVPKAKKHEGKRIAVN